MADVMMADLLYSQMHHYTSTVKSQKLKVKSQK